MASQIPEIPRHKTAIRRNDFSLPVKCLLRDSLLNPGLTFFDYGCGHGENIERLRSKGINCEGWDPAFRPNSPFVHSDIVNLGYVINVIEEPAERAETLRHAWKLSRKVLIVSAQIMVSGRGKQQVEFSDGILTRRGTFQKFFTQTELREFIESILGTEALPAALGVYYVFKEEEFRQQFLANRYRRYSTGLPKRLSERKFEDHKELLEQFIQCIQELGRVPAADEFKCTAAVINEFGSLKRAFALIRRVTGLEEWEKVENERRNDFLVYLALGKFRKRPKLKDLPLGQQRDIRAFFGTYAKARNQADELLFRAGDADAIDTACKQSEVGKLLPNALYFHRNALECLCPLLRVYEGCGRAFLGEFEHANIIKIHRFSGKISYLEYRDFENDPHPELVRSFKFSMRTQQLHCFDYSTSENPPILHRKETFLEPSHPLYKKFARLTQQEEKYGLLDNPRSIGTKISWKERLMKTGFEFRGHRIVQQ